MDYTTLGRTGIKVSVAGLGSGGSSQLGQRTGKSEAEIVALVHRALDLGVNFIDTAAQYKTEPVIGKALKTIARDKVVISTKAWANEADTLFTADQVVASLDNSLRQLGTNYVDVFMLHGVSTKVYPHARDALVPALLKEKAKGKFRALGITEFPPRDPGHDALQTALRDDPWDVIMIAFHMMNQNARQTVFPVTQKQGVGTLLMFAVRSIFSQPARLREVAQMLAERGDIPADLAARDNPLDFLIHAAGADSLSDAAYRFVRHEPGVDIVLFGTGDIGHLQTNIASIAKPPLPAADRDRIVKLFGHLVGVGLDPPTHVKTPRA